FLVARDTMHQNQWLAAWEGLGGPAAHPIPTNFPQEDELQDVSYAFMSLGVTDDVPAPRGRWSSGRSMDGRGEFTTRRMRAMGEKPDLGPASPRSGAQQEQMAPS